MYNYSKFKFIKYFYAKLIINFDIYKMQFISKYNNLSKFYRRLYAANLNSFIIICFAINIIFLIFILQFYIYIKFLIYLIKFNNPINET